MVLSESKKYQLLLEIAQKVRDTLDLDEISEHLLDIVRTVVYYDAAGIFVLNQELVHRRHEQPRAMIAGITLRGFDQRPPDGDDMLLLGKGVVGHVISTSSSLVIPDVRQEPLYIEGRSQTRSEIAVPIVRGSRAIGALNLECDHLSAFDTNDLEVLNFFADAASISIEKAMLHRQLLERELIATQLRYAQQAQSRLFPGKPPAIPGYDIAGICLPAEEIGGDYFDFIKIPHRRIGMAVADVSGSGIPAALMMTSFRGILRLHARGKLPPAKIAEKLNRQFPEFTGSGDFVTFVYLVLDPEENQVTYVCCGQYPPVMVRSDGQAAYLDVRGPVLGVFRDAKYISDYLILNPGDILAMFTDGVVDSTNTGGAAFGVERLTEAIRRDRNLPAGELIHKVIQETRQFSGSQSFQDDFTLVLIKRL